MNSNPISTVVITLMAPLMLLNTLGAIVSGIWLAILGEWSFIGLGILALIISVFPLSLALAPGIIIALPGVALFDKGRNLIGSLFVILSGLYSYSVITAWCILTIYFFTNQMTDPSIPKLLWAYGVATGPLGYMAQKEDDPNRSGIAVFSAQIAFVITMIAILFVGLSLNEIILLFGTTMLVLSLLQIALDVMEKKRSSSYI